jgi:Cu+-exporting ATPase
MARQSLLAVSNPVPGSVQVGDVVEGRREVVSVLVDGSATHLDQVVVPAGAPATLVFSGDTECAASVEFADLESQATADRDGTVSVELPALPPGAYPFSCLRGCISGVVLAQ